MSACPDRCGGKAEHQGVEPSGLDRWTCTRCGEVWWTPPRLFPPPERFDADEGARRRDRGMALASEAEGETWQAWARRTITALADTGEPFTADDLVAAAIDQGREPAHHNAIGAAFNAASRAGVIVATGSTRQTGQTRGHRRRQLVWRAP